MSIALSRQMLWRMLGADHPMEAHKVDSRAIFAMGQSADAHERRGPFLEKRFTAGATCAVLRPGSKDNAVLC